MSQSFWLIEEPAARREKLAHLRREATGEALRKTIDSEPVEQPAFAIGVAQRRWCSLVQYGKIIPHQNLARQRLVALAILRLKDMAFDLQDQFDRLRIAHSFDRSEEHTSALQSLMRISYAVFCLKKKNN